MLKIHADIYKKLDYFIEKNKIPNIIFHGNSDSREILRKHELPVRNRRTV